MLRALVPSIVRIARDRVRSSAQSLRYFTSTSSSSSSPTPTAAALVIGDEVLSGQVVDSNTAVLAKTLWRRGVKLCKVEIVPDEIDVIVESLSAMRPKYDYIFTSGGIGPTHDDRTYEAVAKAYGLRLEYHEPTKKGLIEYLTKKNSPVNEARLRMALLPTPCKTLETPGSWVPIVVVRDQCHVLPGIPKMFKQMIEGAEGLPEGPHKWHKLSLYTNLYEGEIAQVLSDAESRLAPNIVIGSYPQTDNPDANVVVTVQSHDEKLARDTLAWIQEKLPRAFSDRPPAPKLV